jgi:hypothetical protein
LVEIDVLNPVAVVSPNKNTVFTFTFDVVEIDVRHNPHIVVGHPFGKTPSGILVVATLANVCGDVDRFGFSPPYVGIKFTIYKYIRKYDIFHHSFVPILNSDAPVAVADDAIVEYYVADSVHVFRPDLDGARPGSHHAVGDGNVFAWPEFRIFPSVFEAYTIIPRLYVTVADSYIAGMIDIDAIAVAYLEVVEQTDAVHYHIVAPQQMDGPIGRVADGDILDADIMPFDEG